MIREHDMVMKQVVSVKQQSKKLKLNIKYKEVQGQQSAKAVAMAGVQAEASRATFLLRQAQLKARQGQAEQRGTYGHMIKRKDDRVEGVSALAHKIDMKA